MKRISFWTFIIIVFPSCFKSNEIYFDIGDQSIKSCNSQGLYKLDIQNDSLNEFYSIIWKDSTKDSPKILKITNIDAGYKIFKGWERNPIPNSNFHLKKYSSYAIEKSQGDATPFKVKLFTDENGYVIRSDPNKCAE